MKGGHTSPHDALLTEREFRYFHAHAFHRSVSGSSADSDAKCHWRDGDATKVRLHGTKPLPGVRGDTAPELPFRSAGSHGALRGLAAVAALQDAAAVAAEPVPASPMRRSGERGRHAHVALERGVGEARRRGRPTTELK
jgi:hypothetical protein